jgi:hypothetical protein
MTVGEWVVGDIRCDNAHVTGGMTKLNNGGRMGGGGMRNMADYKTYLLHILSFLDLWGLLSLLLFVFT